jgi:hypothetical protein
MTKAMTERALAPRGLNIRQAAAKPPAGAGGRPPSYMSRKELAWELSVCETTVDVLVRSKVIPPPVKLTPGCVRWWWPAVESAIANSVETVDDGDPYMAGAIDAVKAPA